LGRAVDRPGTKVGGWPRWIQEPEWPVCGCGRRMRHGIMLGDVGSLYLFTCTVCAERPLAGMMQCS
jgi:hypothetical protein